MTTQGATVHRRRDPRPEPPRPRRHRQAPGAAALPPGRRAAPQAPRPVPPRAPTRGATAAASATPAPGAPAPPAPSRQVADKPAPRTAPPFLMRRTPRTSRAAQPDGAAQPTRVRTPRGGRPRRTGNAGRRRADLDRTTPTRPSVAKFNKPTAARSTASPVVDDDPTSRWSPVTPGRHQVPPLGGRRSRAPSSTSANARHPAGRASSGRRQPRLRRPGHRRPSPSISQALAGTQQAVRDRARRPGHLRADFDARDHRRHAQITGNFTEAEAKSLATSLKYGALPITFEKDPTRSRRSAPRSPATSSPPASRPASSACCW